MGIFSSLFSQRKPKKFGYRAIYYDAEKEAREKRIKRLRQESALEENGGEFRKVIHEKWRRNFKQLENKKSNMRILVIAALLSILIYLFFK